MAQQFAVVGKRLPRLGAAERATGAARYAIDIRLPGMLVGKILRCPYPHARILNIDASRAEALPGVEAVITLKDVPAAVFNASKGDLMLMHSEGEIEDQHVLSDTARYAGDAIAAVAAVDDDTACRALQLIEVEYHKLPAVLDLAGASRPGAPRVHDFAVDNLAQHQRFPASGDVEKGFAQADYIAEGTFDVTSRQKYCQPEPTTCIASFDGGGRLTVWSPSQHPWIHKTKLAELFSLPPGMIRWITPPVGGAYGSGLSLKAEPLCVALARKTGRPVKIEFTREEDFVATESRQPFIYSARLGVKRDGAITALEARVTADAGAYFTQSGAASTVSMSYFSTLYRCPCILAEADIIYTNTPVTGGMRGYGNPQAMFALEQLVDMAAEGIGMDPVEFRLRNYRRTGDVYRPPIIMEACALGDCIKLGAEKIGWSEKRGQRKGGVKRRGAGMAVMSMGSNAYPFNQQSSNAFIKLNEDGSADLVVSAMDMGQNPLGTMAQIAAETLGLRASEVHVVSGDTDVTLFDVGQHASRSTYCIGNAVAGAAQQARQQLLERAARMVEAEPGELDVREGRVYFKSDPGRGLPVADVARDAIYNRRGQSAQISGKCSWEPQGNPPCFQAAFAEVEVDTETGQARVLHMVIAHDIGRAINPMSVEGQLEGGMAQGVGYSLTERFAVNLESGVVTTDNLNTYRIPTALDLPEVETILVETDPAPSGPFGAKGVGEASMAAIAPAIANAIYDAVGVRITELPMTGEKIVRALRENQAGSRWGGGK